MSYKRSRKVCRAAAAAEMSENTARKYLRSGVLPSAAEAAHTWRTRDDPFTGDWEEIESLLVQEPRIQSKTVFLWLERQFPGKYQAGQLRTLQRRIKFWRATQGPGKEVIFPQEHIPGRLSASDFTHMKKLCVTINGEEFDHLLYHFVLTYSNWETASICYSESFESLSAGFQNALWELGGASERHRTDQLSSAVHQELVGRQIFTKRWKALMDHYGMEPEKIQAGEAHENGDAEKSHDLLKEAIDQELMLRGSRDFTSVEEYAWFVRELIGRRNLSRKERFSEEQANLRPLPARRLPSITTIDMRVKEDSTIRVAKNTYSVSSRLIGEKLSVRLGADCLSVWYGGVCIESAIERLRGENGHRINYRHVIDSLVRKPGAFARYKWRDDLYPTSRFRIAHDVLERSHGSRAVTEYLRILQLAAQVNESAVDEALRALLDAAVAFDAASVEQIIGASTAVETPRDVWVDAVDLQGYDCLMGVCQ